MITLGFHCNIIHHLGKIVPLDRKIAVAPLLSSYLLEPDNPPKPPDSAFPLLWTKPCTFSQLLAVQRFCTCLGQWFLTRIDICSPSEYFEAHRTPSWPWRGSIASVSRSLTPLSWIPTRLTPVIFPKRRHNIESDKSRTTFSACGFIKLWRALINAHLL